DVVAVESEDTADLTETTAPAPVDDGDITDDGFERFLDALAGQHQQPADDGAAAAEAGSSGADRDEITDGEFEAVLDPWHGTGRHTGVAADAAPAAEPVAAEVPAEAGGDDLISDSEFEELLDRLHGKGKHSAAAGADAAATAESVTAEPAADKPAAKTTAKPSEKPAAAKAEPAKAAPAAKAAAAKTAPAPAAAADKDAAAETTVRVDTKRLDDIMNMVGELVLVRNRLVRLGLKSADESMSKAVANLDVVTGDLQAAVMKTRMQPIKKVFGRFPRVVRDLARQLKKEINLELRGEETDLDKNLVEALADPLVHLVRNSVDHGVEMPDEREKKGKPRVGTVLLSAEQEGDHILLIIQDDGHGMNADVLRRKAVEK